MIDTALLGLFTTALLAATVLPLASEPVAVALLAVGRSIGEVWLAATLGNLLGAIVNWWLGREVRRWRTRVWFPVSAEALERAERWFRRFGRPALLLSWLPVIGDALTVAAGTLRTPLGAFVVLVALGKGGRYAVLLALASGAIP